MDLYDDAGDAYLSGLSAKNDFSSPDGLWFSRASDICWIQTDDGKTLFVNIQHPGEDTPAFGSDAALKLQSQWPGNQGYGPAGRPRWSSPATTAV